jgi:beta-mannosidase
MSGAGLASAEWSLASTRPGQLDDPARLDGESLQWFPAIVPGTVAQSLQQAGAWDFDHPRDFDSDDWWYRCTFAHDAQPATAYVLRFAGLATLAEIWLNGERIAETDNMFVEQTIDVTAQLRASNVLAIRFRSLHAALAQRRARPRWKTKLVAQQQLRWIRTTLLGRIPGWTPPVAAVGPWRPVTLEARPAANVSAVIVRATLDGSTGVVAFECEVAATATARISGRLLAGGISAPLTIKSNENFMKATARLQIDDARLWFPHTHGTPELYDCSAIIDIDGISQTIDCGSIGFRKLEVVQHDQRFSIRVNGVDIFCRGACWTPNDVVSLSSDNGHYAQTLTLLRDAGANMVRIGGTMVYEADAFHRLCDELGILVWQDFMFANMDYPADDAHFAASVREEATQLLQRLGAHPSTAVFCGNSEVEQQAAMLGVPRESWRNSLFADELPALCAELAPGTGYVPSTPTGGALPFHTATGITHYYGVGAYMRPISDARRANVAFTPECLAFANVPRSAIVDLVMQGDTPATHDPRWKERTPRDRGAGWDFEDVRDHYLRETFGLDPVQLRCFDPPRYLDLSRITTGEIMSQLYSEWRSTHSDCYGALVWFLRDPWPGAGWGIIDSGATPKACFHYLARVWQPRTVVLTDEGLDGLHAHVVNERAESLNATLEMTLLRDGHVVIATNGQSCEVAPRSTSRITSDELLGGFYDVTYAYRFGPPKHDVTIATLLGSDGDVLAEAFHFPRPYPQHRVAASVVAQARRSGDDSWILTLTSDQFLYAAHIDLAKGRASDDYFHLAPTRTKSITISGTSTLRGSIEALNLGDAVRIVVNE